MNHDIVIRGGLVVLGSGGAPRDIQRATGYKATLVDGRVKLIDGEWTGERAGQVLRHRSRASAG